MTQLPLVEPHDAPSVELTHLDDLWFQVSGTLCNLTCTHCFISCSPHNHAFGFLDLDMIRRALEESVRLGVKEYYFTGGEPFLHRDMSAILELTLHYGPATVLTNGTVLKDEWLERLRAAEDASPYSLEFRVSMDGFTAAENDAVRGAGTFERILRGVRQLLAHDFLPILTVTRVNDDDDGSRLFQGFVDLLKDNGYDRPRMKVLPALRLGAEIQRRGAYQAHERVTREMLVGYDTGQLVCSHSRVVTDRGVYVCPILLDSQDARLGERLVDADRAFALRQQACFTCWQYGALCANASAAQRDA
jgi:sulfatase maturation enzyme AslB (radical SAM superfamily)